MKLKFLPACFALTITIAAASGFDASSMTVELSGFSAAYLNQSATRYIISSSEEEFTLPASSHQKIISEKISGGRKIIETECGVQVKNLRAPQPSESADARFLNISSKEISSAAAQFAASKDKAADIENFVYRHISDKRYGIPLIPADAVYRVKAGDCTEHAVLAAALLRAVKVPARAVTGMVFESSFSGRKNVFVFHMWVEVYSNGRWVLIDATRPGKKFLNRYIALAYHNLKSDAPLDYLTAISAVRGMKIEYAGGR